MTHFKMLCQHSSEETEKKRVNPQDNAVEIRTEYSSLPLHHPAWQETGTNLLQHFLFHSEQIFCKRPPLFWDSSIPKIIFLISVNLSKEMWLFTAKRP
jgi:hypothetical protein